MKIVSLVPSVTETLLAWNIKPTACTRFCEQPTLRHVGGTKDPDIAAIVELKPDLVVVDREENQKEDAEALIAQGITVCDLHVVSVHDVPREMQRLSDLVGGPTLELSERVEQEQRSIAFVPIWRRPWMTISEKTYGATLLKCLGIQVFQPDSPDAYPTLSDDDLAGLAAQMVLLPTEPYVFSERHIAEVQERTGISDVRIIDGKDLFWWGARTNDALARLGKDLARL
jgi:ABC-type Fe3+-hydroxamate transport system substrate-binding protein